jgi:signal transduction histidine kinase
MAQYSLKQKLFSGFGFLFFMIVLLWLIGGYFIYNLSSRSAAMLKENYQTVESAKFLIQSLDKIKNQQIQYFFANEGQFNQTVYSQNLSIFNEHLNAVENNITEEGEQEIIFDLKSAYSNYLSAFEKIQNTSNNNSGRFFRELIPDYTLTHNLIVKLWDTNMNAISHKNGLLRNTANRAFIMISFAGTFCFLIAAYFFVFFPRSITRPLTELTRSIKEIANRNYSQRLDFHSRDEIGEVAAAFNTMAAKLDEYEHSNLSELLFEKKRIDTIINNMKDGIIGLNEKDEIIFSNTNACEILSVAESEILGKSAPDIASQNQVLRVLLNDISNKTKEEYKEFKPLRILTGKKIKYYSREILDVKITKTGEKAPIRVGVVIVLKNITHFLEQDEAKTNFMATISHELKTPISSLRLNLKLLDDKRIGRLNGEQKEIVGALKSESNKMLTITSELLDLARLETGNITLNTQKVDIKDLFGYIKETSANQAQEKGINIHFQTELNLPPVLADSEKTAFTLSNLINNAIRYSDEESEIIVSASLQNGEVVFIVQDFGKGIENRYLEKIFEKYFQVPGSEKQGTGLGLAISKEFITKQNGRIWAESEIGKGSRFFFTLPVYS